MEFTIFINSIDRTADILYNSFRISDYINQQVDTCSFDCKKFKPLLNQEIQVKYGDDTIYGGVIVKVETEVKKGENIYKVTCKDYSQYLNRRLVSERYINKTVSEIIDDLLDEYATDFTANNTPDDGLLTDRIAYWKLDETSGDAEDIAGGHTGVNTDVTYSTGKIGNAGVFNGTSSKFVLSSNEELNPNEITISAWVYRDGIGATDTIIGDGTTDSGCLQFRIDSGNKLSLVKSYVVGIGSSTGTIPATTWTHCLAIYNQTTGYYAFYINGSLSGSGTNIQTLATKALSIGSNHLTEFMEGKIDELGIWSRALSETEITELYNSGAGKQYPFDYSLVSQITFNRLNLSQCIQSLAELLNYSWYVDYAKDIHFFAENDEEAPFNLTETAGNHAWESLKLINDFSQIRNQIYIIGGDSEAEPRTEEYVADGEQRQFPLAYKYSQITRVRIVGDPDLTVGIDGQDEETAFNVFWSGNKPSQYIRFKDSNYPDASDVVEVTGVPLFPVLVKVPDVASIAQYGLYEFKIKDTQITSRTDAIARGTVELQAYADSIEEGSFTTNKYGLRSGQTIRITIGDTDEDFIIQSVSMNMLDPFNGQWNVKLATVRTLGIIRFLQQYLKIDDEITEGEVLLELQQFADESASTDSVDYTTDTPPYKWADATDPDDEGKWNFFTWA